MTNCAKCGELAPLPYTCRRCQRQYCAKHRLPESHDCTGLRAKDKEEPPHPSIKVSESTLLGAGSGKREQRREAGGPEFRVVYSYTGETLPNRSLTLRGKSTRYSRTEALHILIALGLLALLSLSFMFPYFPLVGPSFFDLTAYVFLTSILFLSFLPHELMHKVVAQKYGLFAEFRIIPSYAMLTLLTIFLPAFKLFAPGAVMIGGNATMEAYGKTAAAGPSTNLTIGGALFGLAFIFPDYGAFLLIGASISGWLGFFNMLPLPPFDGEKVLHWSKATYVILLIGSLVLFLSSNLL